MSIDDLASGSASRLHPYDDASAPTSYTLLSYAVSLKCLQERRMSLSSIGQMR